jgi:hypothetical protein
LKAGLLNPQGANSQTTKICDIAVTEIVEPAPTKMEQILPI